MKRQAYILIAMLVLIGSVAVATHGQGISHTDLRARIPFEFHAGDQTLPAGEYRVLPFNVYSGNALIKIESINGKSGALLRMAPVEGSRLDKSALVFHSYGNKYFFSEVWVAGEGLRVPGSRAERAAQRDLAAVKRSTETVALKAQ